MVPNQLNQAYYDGVATRNEALEAENERLRRELDAANELVMAARGFVAAVWGGPTLQSIHSAPFLMFRMAIDRHDGPHERAIAVDKDGQPLP